MPQWRPLQIICINHHSFFVKFYSSISKFFVLKIKQGVVANQHLYKIFNGKRKDHKGWTGKYLLKQGKEYNTPTHIEKIKLRQKMVARVSDDGEILGIWYSIGECAKSLTNDKKKHHSLERCIGKVLRGERKQTHGMKFKYTP